MEAERLARLFPVLTVLGPRQSGKSTFCRMVFPEKDYVTLEDPDTRRAAMDDPRGFLARFSGGAILDEIQRAPELSSYLQGIVDDQPGPGAWILTGSQNFRIMEGVTQSLAGRSAILNLLPCERQEVEAFEPHPEELFSSILAGGYPRLHDVGIPPKDWFAAYVGTYVERDVRQLLQISDLRAFHTFLELCASRSGQILNVQSLASDCGKSSPTIKSWLSVLEASFLCFRLRPLHANIRKRLVKSPKLYFHDTGLLCWLLGIRTAEQLRTHPLRGAIFETWVVSEILKQRVHRGEAGPLFYFRDSHGKEVDLIVETRAGMISAEVKSGSTAPPSPFKAQREVAQALATVTGAPWRSVLVFGGDRGQERTEGDLLSWRELAVYPWD